MIQEFTKQPLFSAWPFWILEIDPSADNRAIEKAYQKVAASLQLKIPNAEFFSTPLGQRQRDEFSLREAKAILTNPEQRIIAEFWYIAPDTQFESAKTHNNNVQNNELDQVDWKKLLGTF